MTGHKQIGILQQREIEVGVIAPIYQVLVERYGKEAARSVIEEAILADAEEAGREFARQAAPGKEMRHFIDIQEYWEQDDALETSTWRSRIPATPTTSTAAATPRCTSGWACPSWARSCPAVATSPSPAATTPT